MAKVRIGVDLDGVVYNWDDTVRYLIRHHHGIELEPAKSWDYVQDNVPADVWHWLWNEGIDLGLFKYGSYIKGSIDGLQDLATRGSLEIITHRPRDVMQDTLRFIAGLPDVFDGVHILTKQEPKSSVGCDIYIDDNAAVIDDVVAAGLEAIVFDQPWNQNSLVNRAFGWKDMPRAIKEAQWRICL